MKEAMTVTERLRRETGLDKVNCPMHAKDPLPRTAAQNVVRYHGCGFALIGDGCHA